MQKAINETEHAKAKEFGELIQKYTHKLLEGMSIGERIKINHLDLNKEAIKLAQQERREGKEVF